MFGRNLRESYVVTTILFISALCLMLTLSVRPHNPDAPKSGPAASAARHIASITRDLAFEPNHGQLRQNARFVASGRGYNIGLDSSGAAIYTTDAANPILAIELAGGNPGAPLSGDTLLPGKVHRYQGPKKQQQYTNIPTYSRVRLAGVYPGIDAVYYGRKGELEYDLVIQPGASPDAIRLRFAGADKLVVDNNGDLLLATRVGTLTQKAPFAYQDIAGTRYHVPSRYVIDQQNRHVRIALNDYDPAYPLTIDPILSYSSYLGSASDDAATSIAADAAGNMYLTYDSSYKIGPNTYQTVEVIKLAPAGTELYRTMLLDSVNINTSYNIAIDGTGNAYVVGSTDTTTALPVTANAYQASNADGGAWWDVYVIALDASGAVTYGTYLGGTRTDEATGIATDGTTIHITGYTGSNNFPVTAATASDTQCGDLAPGDCVSTGQTDAFYVRLDPAAASGSASMLHSTFLGGSGHEVGYAVALNGGVAYIAGETTSSGLPAVNAYDATENGGKDALIVGIDPAQTGAASLVYSSYFGGSTHDRASGIAVDGSGTIYIVGDTFSVDLPTAGNAYASAANAGQEVFVAKLDTSQTGTAQLTYGSYYGGGAGEVIAGYQGNSLGLDASGRVYFGGLTGSSTDLPVTIDAFQTSGSAFHAYFAVIDTVVSLPTSSLVFSTYIGGDKTDEILDVTTLSDGTTYLVGVTASTAGFLLSADAQQTTNASTGASSQDAFVMRISPASAGTDLGVSMVPTPNPVAVSSTLTYTITVVNNGPDPATGVTLTDTIPASTTLVSATPSQGSCAGNPTVSCDIGAMASGATVTVNIAVTTGGAAGQISNTASVTGNEVDPNNSNDNATTLVDVTQTTDLAITSHTASAAAVDVGALLTYTINFTNNGGPATGVTVSDTLPANVALDAANSDARCTGTSTIICTIGAMATSVTDSVTIGVRPTSLAASTISNTASVAAIEADANTADNSLLATPDPVTVNPVVDLAITGYSGVPASVNVGDTVPYSVTITNNGPSDASGVTVSGTLPANTTFNTGTSDVNCTEAAGIITCTQGTFAASTSTSFLVVLNTAAATAGTLNFGMTVAGNETDSNAANDTLAAPVVTVNAVADLGIGLVAAPDPVNVGSSVIYTATITNYGPNNSAGSTVTNVLPAGTTFDAGNSSAGCVEVPVGTVSCPVGAVNNGASTTVNIALVPGAAAAGVLGNTISVTASEVDTNNANDSASTNVTVNPVADLVVTAYSGAPNPVAVGSSLVYTATIANNGPNTATGVTVSSTLPANVVFDAGNSSAVCAEAPAGTVTCTVSSLASGANTNVLIAMIPGAAAIGTLNSSVSVTAIEADSNGTNNTLAAAAVAVNGVTDLSIGLTAAPNPVNVGSSVIYTATITNNGPNNSSGSTVSNILPANSAFDPGNSSAGCTEAPAGTVTCPAGAINSGASTTVNIALIPGAGAVGTLGNTMSIAANETDGNNANDNASINVTVNPVVDLSFTAFAGAPNPVTVNNSVIYTVTAANAGPNNATAVKIENILPANTAFDAANSSGLCSELAGTVTCTIGVINAGANITIPLALIPSVTGVLTNTVTTMAAEADVNAANNIATTNVTVAAPTDADVTVSISVPAVVSINTPYDYVISVTNNGPAAASNINVTGAFPAGITANAAVPSQGGPCTIAGSLVCLIGNLLPGMSAAITVNVTATTTGIHSHDASVTATETDPDGTNNTTAVTTQAANTLCSSPYRASALGGAYLRNSSCTVGVSSSGATSGGGGALGLEWLLVAWLGAYSRRRRP